jgi:hypothetical protein
MANYNAIQVGFSEYLVRFFNQLEPTTKSLESYILRDVAKSIVWCPSRMYEMVDEQLLLWGRNDTDSATSTAFKLPVIMIAFGRNISPVGRDYGRRLTEGIPVIFPDDTKERSFKMKLSRSDIAVQLSFFSNDIQTSFDLCKSFVDFIDTMGNHCFSVNYRFAGLNLKFDMLIDTDDYPAQAHESESKNISIHSVNLSIKSSIPTFLSPKDNEPNDGKGTDGDINDPHGYPVITAINTPLRP